MNLDELRNAVSNLDWVYAKTMPKYPHWYITRNPLIEEIYVDLFNAIVAHGKDELFRRRPVQYLYLGDGYKYWRMTDNINRSQVLNRAKEDAVYVS
jgi:hypothetical protein